MGKFKLITALLMITVSSYAQKRSGNKLLSFSPAYEVLKSTHGNLFRGPSFKINKALSNNSAPGLGVEYAASAIHHDNGFVLYDLKFVPVYINYKYNFIIHTKFSVYAETSLGFSFNQYYIADELTPDNKTRVNEGGFYAYGGTGVNFRLNKSTDIYTGAGLKGYKMSFNSLHVNPHGVTVMLGVRFH